jgi:hypothetical protein
MKAKKVLFNWKRARVNFKVVSLSPASQDVHIYPSQNPLFSGLLTGRGNRRRR